MKYEIEMVRNTFCFELGVAGRACERMWTYCMCFPWFVASGAQVCLQRWAPGDLPLINQVCKWWSRKLVWWMQRFSKKPHLLLRLIFKQSRMNTRKWWCFGAAVGGIDRTWWKRTKVDTDERSSGSIWTRWQFLLVDVGSCHQSVAICMVNIWYTMGFGGSKHVLKNFLGLGVILKMPSVV